ncbi:MFS transporter [Brenneria sp. 4F2]|nr:MFS transporter [Brenneria bubanii]
MAEHGGETCYLAVPCGTRGQSFTQFNALRQPAILMMMSVTVLGGGASFFTFTFITPILTGMAGFSPSTASLLLAVFGIATLFGNLVGEE